MASVLDDDNSADGASADGVSAGEYVSLAGRHIGAIGSATEPPKEKLSKKKLMKELKDAFEKNNFLREELSRLTVEQSLREGVHNVCSSTMRESNTESRNESLLLATMNSWTLGTLSVPECVPMQGETEIDKRSYEYWKETLLASLQLVNTADERAKYGVFKVKAGVKLREIYNTTVSTPGMPDEELEPFSNAIARLDDYFGSRTYILSQRGKLMNLSQSTTESSIEFVRRVAVAAKLCNYNVDEEMEAVVRVITKGASDARVRVLAHRNWVSQGTMKNLIDLVRDREVERENEEEFQRTRRGLESANVAAVSTNFNELQFQRQTDWRGRGIARGSFRGNRGNRRGGRGYNQGMLRNQKGIDCWRCGSSFHRSSGCPNSEKVCHNCGRVGHIARVCSSSRQHAQGSSWKRPSDSEERGVPRKIAAIEAKQEQQEPTDKVQDDVQDLE